MNLSNDTAIAIMQAAQPDTQGKADAVTSAAQLKQDARLDAATQDFEAMFVAQMLQPMFADIKVNDMFGGGKGEEIFRGFMIQEYGKIIAETGQLGIADAVKRQLLETQSQQ